MEGQDYCKHSLGSVNLVRSSCKVRSLLLLVIIYPHKLIMCWRDKTALRRRMGGTKSLSKFIVDWKNGTGVACNNGASRARNMDYICTAVSP